MLKQRIQILQTGGVIGAETATFVNRVIDMMQVDYPSIDPEHGAMFTTHLAMAVERIKKGEIVDAMDEFCWRQIEDTSQFSVAEEFRDKMLEFCPISFPKSESDFIVLHICNMLES